MITLLNASLRTKGCALKKQMGVETIAPFRPACQARQVKANLASRAALSAALNALEKSTVKTTLPVCPARRRAHCCVVWIAASAPQWRRDANLQREQACSGLGLDSLTQAFAGQPAERLTNSNGTHISITFGQRVERGSRDEGCQFGAPVVNSRITAAS